MLYDELVPQGEYLAHYGVPKDQWSPEARARHNRNHPQKGDVSPTVYRQLYENTRGAYDEYQNNNYNRGGNRHFTSKVDEHRAQLAEARRRRRGEGNINAPAKPDDGQHVSSYRKPARPGSAKPNIHSSGGSSSPSKPSSTVQELRNTRNRKPGSKTPIKPNNGQKTPGSMKPIVDKSNGSKSVVSNKGNSGKGIYTTNKANGAKSTYSKSSYTQDKGNGSKATPNKKRSKNAHSGGGYSDRAANIYDRPTGHRTLHSGNAGPGSIEQIGSNTYRRVDYESRRRRR